MALRGAMDLTKDHLIAKDREQWGSFIHEYPSLPNGWRQELMMMMMDGRRGQINADAHK